MKIIISAEAGIGFVTRRLAGGDIQVTARVCTKPSVSSGSATPLDSLEEQVMTLVRDQPGIGLKPLLVRLATSASTGIRVLNTLRTRGLIVRNGRGTKSRYFAGE